MSICASTVVTCDTCGDVLTFTDPLKIRNLRLSAATHGWRIGSDDGGVDTCRRCRQPQGQLEGVA